MADLERIPLSCPPMPKTIKVRGTDGKDATVPTPPELIQWGDNVRAMLDVAWGNRREAEAMRFVTLAELVNSGLIQAALTNGTRLVRNPNTVTGTLTVDLPNVSVDKRLPETPAGVTATATFKAIILTWAEPLYDFHDHTEIWRNTSNNLATAVHYKDTSGAVWSDSVGTGSTFWYWLRHVGSNGRPGAFANGVTATTGKIVGSDEIQNLTITNALIANLAVDDAKIASLSASKLTAGTIDASVITVNNLSATNITAGLLNVARINNLSLDTLKFANDSVSTLVELHVNEGADMASAANNLLSPALNSSTNAAYEFATDIAVTYNAGESASKWLIVAQAYCVETSGSSIARFRMLPYCKISGGGTIQYSAAPQLRVSASEGLMCMSASLVTDLSNISGNRRFGIHMMPYSTGAWTIQVRAVMIIAVRFKR